MPTATEEKPRPAPEAVTWGDPEDADNLKTLRGWEYKFGSAPQSLPGYRVGVATDRAAQEGAIKAVLGDQSAGVRPRPGIGYWQSDALRSHIRNEGWQTRVGIPSLPYVLETQAAIPHVGGIDLSNLAVAWMLNEASGDALDSSGNARTATETGGSIGTTTGLFYALARDFVAANADYFLIADAAWNSAVGDKTIVLFAKPRSGASGDDVPISKQDFGTNYSWRLVCQNGSNRWSWKCSDSGVGDTSANAANGSITYDAWQMITLRHRNGVNIGISVNLDTEVTAAFTGSIFDGNADLVIGAGNEGGGERFEGALQGILIFDEVLSTDAQSLIYAAAAGSTFAELQQPEVSDWNSLNIRAHQLPSSLGGSVERWYCGVSTNLLRNDNAGATRSAKSEVEAALCNVDGAGSSYVLPGKVTAIAHLQVSQARVFALALEDYGVVYTADPTASPVVFTKVVDFESGDRVDGMGFMEDLGPNGTNIFSGKINGINAAAWWADSTMTASTTLRTVSSAIGKDSFPAESELILTAAASAVTATSVADGSAEDWTTPENITASDGAYATNSLALTSISDWLVASGFVVSGPAATDTIRGIIVNVEAKESSAGRTAIFELQLRINGTVIGVVKNPHSMLTSSDVVYRFGGPQDAWFTELTGADLSSLQVYVRFYNFANNSSTVSVDHITLQVGYQAVSGAKTVVTPREPLGVARDEAADAAVFWDEIESVFEEDGVWATVSPGDGTEQLSDTLLIGPIARRGELPSAALIDGLQARVKRGPDADNEPIQDVTVQLWSGGSFIGANRAFINGSWNTSTTNSINEPLFRSYGGEGDNWGITGLTGADLSDIYLAIRVSGTTAGSTARLDYVEFAFTYKESGTVEPLPLGGWSPGVSPDESSTMYRVVPPVDEEATIVQPRTLKKLVMAWDTSGGRPVVTSSRVATGMNHVHHANHALGGIMATGDHAGGPGRLLHLISRTGAVYDQNFAGVHGTVEVRVNSISYVQGLHSLLDVVDADYANRQFWTLRDQTYFADWIMQSKSERTIDEQPIVPAEAAIDLSNDRMYSLFPKDGGLAVSRVFVPRDLNADPRIVDTTEVRSMAWSGTDGSRTEDTALYLYMGIIDFGPPEAAKAISLVSQHSYRVDSGSTYGTTKFEATIDGSVPDGSDAFDLTFAAGLSDQTNYAYDQAIPGAQDYRTLNIRLGGTHTAATAKSPDLGPFLMTTNQMWLDDELINILVDRSHINEADSEFMGFDDWREFAWKKPTRTLSYSGRQVLAQWVGWREGDSWASLPALGTLPGEGPPLLAVWRRVPGEVDPAS